MEHPADLVLIGAASNEQNECGVNSNTHDHEVYASLHR